MNLKEVNLKLVHLGQNKTKTTLLSLALNYLLYLIIEVFCLEKIIRQICGFIPKVRGSYLVIDAHSYPQVPICESGHS